MAAALFGALCCLALVFVTSLLIPQRLSIPFVVFGIALVRVIAALGPTLHIQFRPPRRGGPMSEAEWLAAADPNVMERLRVKTAGCFIPHRDEPK